MKIAVVGAGVSGLVCAHVLRRAHDVTLFESADYPGGHTNTVDVPIEGRTVPVDTGFIVFNPGAYPNFCALLDQLGVESQPTTMSFSVRRDDTGLEWGGSGLAGVFAQKRNLLRRSFWAMLRDMRRFARLAPAAGERAPDAPLGDHLDSARYSRGFIDDYLLPMAGAIWSSPPEGIRTFPLRAFVAFFENHGMLTPWKAPQWRTVVGGSRTYVDRIVSGLRGALRLNTPIERITREEDRVLVEPAAGAPEPFDEAVLACHSDQALAMLADPSKEETDILSAIRYQPNDAVLHTDASLLPSRRAAWAAWNYHKPLQSSDRVTVTYHMNTLQRLPVRTPLCVTLNETESIDPAKIIARYTYHHPVYTPAVFTAQARWAAISGARRTHFCGAYWGYGFHEDGVRSALRVCERFGMAL